MPLGKKRPPELEDNEQQPKAHKCAAALCEQFADENKSTFMARLKKILSSMSKGDMTKLAEALRTIDIVRTGSACTGSNVCAYMLRLLFVHLRAGALQDSSGCEIDLGVNLI